MTNRSSNKQGSQSGSKNLSGSTQSSQKNLSSGSSQASSSPSRTQGQDCGPAPSRRDTAMSNDDEEE